MVCSKCGAKIPRGSMYCNKCGQAVIIDNKIQNEVKLKNDNSLLKSENKSKIKKQFGRSSSSKTLIPSRKFIFLSLFIISICSIVIIIGHNTDYTFSYKYNQTKENDKDNLNGDTALIRYIKDNNLSKVQELINTEVDLNLKNKDGDTALLVASKLENSEIVKLLVAKKVKIDLYDKEKNTALLIAVQKNNKEIAKTLIDAGAVLHVKDKNENPMTLIALENGNKELFEILINAGADKNAMNNKFETALHIASKKRELEIVKFLIKKGVSLNYFDNNGDNCIDVASKLKDYELLKLLTNNKKDITAEILIQKAEMETSILIKPDTVSIPLKGDEIYDFYMVDGKKTLYDKDGYKIYEGEVKNGKINGYGTEFYGNDGVHEIGKIVYKGYWKNGLWNGTGQIYAGDIILYETNFVDGFKGVDGFTENDDNKNSSSTMYEPKIGMTAEEVRNSSWGLPKSVNKTTTKYGTNEQWVYPNYNYIYLENGVVTAIQESN